MAAEAEEAAEGAPRGLAEDDAVAVAEPVVLMADTSAAAGIPPRWGFSLASPPPAFFPFPFPPSLDG